MQPQLVSLGLAFAGLFVAVSAQAGSITAVSRSAPDSVFDSANGASDTSRRHAVSADGQIVVFVSSATNLVPGQLDLNGQADAFVLDRSTGSLTLLTRRSGTTATTGNGTAMNPVVSADGSHIAFISTATDLLDTPLPEDSSQRLYVYDRNSATLTLVDRHLSIPELVTASFTGGAGFSDDGRWLVFASSASDLVVDQDDSNNGFDVFLYDTQNDSLRLVSHTPSFFSDTSAGDGGSGTPQISADGRYIVYASTASNLVQSGIDGNGGNDVFVFDRNATGTGVTRLVSHSSASSSFAANGPSENPTISRDGSTIAFTTQGTNLVAGVTDTNGDSDVYVYDRATQALTLVSHNASSNSTTSVQYSGNPNLSPDGRYVLHTSSSANVVPGQIDSARSDDLFLFDRNDASLVLISHAAGVPAMAGSSESQYGFFSDDGTQIVFTSRADNLVAGQVDTNSDGDPLLGEDVYRIAIANLAAGPTLVSHVPGLPAAAGKRMSYTPSITADGNQIVYVSQSDELPSGAADANAATDILLWNAGSNASTLLSHHAAGADDATLMGASQVKVSRDGAWIAFVSRSPSVVAGQIDTNKEDDLFLLERATGNVRLISHVPGSALQAGNRGVALTSSSNITISADGRYVAFESNASDLAQGELDNNQLPDVLLFDRLATPTASLRLVSRRTGGGSGDAASSVPRIAADGSAVVFLSTASDLIAGVSDGNGSSDVFRYDIAAATLQLVSRSAADPNTTASGNASGTSISDDGRYVAYLDTAANLVAGQTDTNGAADVFLFDAQGPSNHLISHTVASPTTAASMPGIVNQAPVLSAGAEYVAFASEATNLVSNFQNNIGFPFGANTQVYRWTRASDSNELLSRAPDGFGNPSGDGAARLPSISGDGLRVAFISSATSLVAGQTDDPVTDDVFLWDQASGVRLVSHLAGQPLQAAQSAQEAPVLSTDGHRLVYGNRGTAIAVGTTQIDSQQQLYLYVIDTDATALITPYVLDPHQAPRAYTERAAIDASASTVVFLSPSPDLVDFDGNASADAFVYRRGTGVPQLAAPGDLTLPEDEVAGPLGITLSDADTPTGQLAVGVESSDPALLPPENIVLTPAPGGYALTATPTTEASGSTTVTLRAIDPDANQATASFVLTWTPVNDAPSLLIPADQAMNEDGVLGPLPVTVGDVESGPDDVTLSATSSNPAIVPPSGIVFGGSGADRTVTATPAQDAYGPVTITVTAHDPAAGGPTSVASFTIDVAPVNDPPFLIAPASTTVAENGNSGTLYFGLADIESPPDALTLTVASSNPALLPVSGIATSGTGGVRTLVATPLLNASGSATVTLTVTDPDGASRSASFVVTVTPATANVDLQLTLGNGQDYVGVGIPSTWTLHVHNTGPGAVSGARLRDALPAGFAGTTWTCVPGAGAQCATANGNGALDLALDLAAGASVDVLLTTTAGAGAVDPLVYSATILPGPGTHETHLADNTASDSDPLGDYLYVSGFETRE